MKTGTVITVFMDIWLLTAVVRAETISGRWEKVEALSPGTAVIVKLQGGERLEGTFKSTGPDEIVFVESGGMERRFPRIAVLRIETASVVPDRLCNGALLREHHLIEDTTGKRCDLFYLRDKEKNEVDFLTVVDGKPDLMVEVKAADDNFSKSLRRFHGFLPGTKAVQLVYGLRQPKSVRGADIIMLSAHEFLAKIKPD